MPAPQQQIRGGPTAHNETVWVWVEDMSTGHRYDVQVTAFREGMVPVPGVALHRGKRPRPTKYRTDLAGEPAAGPRVLPVEAEREARDLTAEPVPDHLTEPAQESTETTDATTAPEDTAGTDTAGNGDDSGATGHRSKGGRRA